MNNFFHENKRVLWLLLSLLFVLLIVLYFIFLKPTLEDIDGVQASSQELKSDIDQLKQELEAQKDDEKIVHEVSEQESKLPKTKRLDQLLLTFEEIEAVSSSRIVKVDFSYDGDFPETGMDEAEESNDETREESDADDNQGDDVNETGEENDAEDKQVMPAIDISDKPEALQPIIVELEVASPNYKRFKQFLTEVEKQERITVVSTLEFEKPGEEELIKAETPSKIMTFKVQLMTFYLDR